MGNMQCLNPITVCENDHIDGVFCNECKENWSGFHDVYFNVKGISLDNNELINIYLKLPSHIQDIAKKWGVSDTDFRDNAHEFLDKQEKDTSSNYICIYHTYSSKHVKYRYYDKMSMSTIDLKYIIYLSDYIYSFLPCFEDVKDVLFEDPLNLILTNIFGLRELDRKVYLKSNIPSIDIYRVTDFYDADLENKANLFSRYKGKDILNTLLDYISIESSVLNLNTINSIKEELNASDLKDFPIWNDKEGVKISPRRFFDIIKDIK